MEMGEKKSENINQIQNGNLNKAVAAAAATGAGSWKLAAGDTFAPHSSINQLMSMSCLLSVRPSVRLSVTNRCEQKSLKFLRFAQNDFISFSLNGTRKYIYVAN